MKNFKSHKMYFPLAMVLSLSPMVFKSIHNEAKPHMERTIASVEEEVKIVKYEKEVFEKDSAKISESLSGVEKQLLDIVLKKDKAFEQSLHEIVNQQFASIDELEKVQAESEEDKKIVADKVQELRAKANELCDKLEQVAAGTKYEEKKEEEKVVEKKEDCDLEQKYAELTKQVESMTADHKKYLDLIVGMNQMMVSMYQHQQPQYSPYTYSSGPFGAAYYPYHNSTGLGQVTNNYYYGGSTWQSPQIMGMGQFGQPNQMPNQIGQQGQVMPQQNGQIQSMQIDPSQNAIMMQPQTMGYDPRFATTNVMPGVFGDSSFMYNFGGPVMSQPSPMIVDGGRAPAVLPF